MKKKLFSLFLILGLILCLTISASAEEVGGSFDDFTWTLDTASGKLTISGEGAMGSFWYGGAPWKDYASQIRTVVIEPGITGAGDYAFNGCSSLTSVTLPEGLTAIEEYCFNGCSSLTQIQLPSTLTSIGESAFGGTGLTSLETPASLKSIGLNAFRGCGSLSSVVLSGNGLTTGYNAFYDCDNLMSLTLNEGISKLGGYAFASCGSLLDVTIPGTVTELERNVFDSCANLRTLTVKEGVTSLPYEGFLNCKNLTTVSLPASLRTLNFAAFRACSKLDNVVIPEGVTSIGANAFDGCSSMTTLTLPSTLTEMGTSAFAFCSSLKEVTIPAKLSTIPNSAFENCKALEKLTIESGVTSIEYGAFSSCNSLTELDIPGTVTGIKSAFSYCEKLKKVTFHSGTTTIDNDAFQSCKALEEVILPDTLTYLGSGAFEFCTSLKSVTIPGSVTTFHFTPFGNSGLRYAKIESGVQQINGWAFMNSRDLIYMVLPDTLKLVHERVFENCDKLCHALITGPETEIIVNKGNTAFDNSVKHFNAKGDEITLHEDCTSVFAYCSICDETIYSETKKNAEHKFGDWILTTAPTTSAEGEETRTCSVCDKTEKRAVAKLPSRNPFTDVPAGSYYEEPVIWAVEEEITNGITPTTFQPKTISTRGQVVTFLWRCAGCPEPKTGLNPFDDVAQSKFYYKAVLWAVENGITNGTSDTTFSPNQNCTRGHVVTFLHRYLNNPKPQSATNPFSDVFADKYYYDAVLWAVDAGVTTGTSATTFSPNNECKRCDIVTFLYRALY